DIRDIDEQRGARQLRRDLVAERILVADVDRDLFTRDREQPLAERAARKIRHRNVHEAQRPREARRREFAERHEMHLVIDLDRRDAEADHAVEELSTAAAWRDAERQAAAV